MAIEPPELRDAIYQAFEDEEDLHTPDDARDAWLGQAPFFCGDMTGPAVAELRATLARARHSVAPMNHDYGGGVDLRDALASSTTPVLAIAGEHDRSIVPEATRQVAELAPTGQLATLDRVGHFPFIEEPEPYLAAVRGVPRRRALTQTQHCSKRPGPPAAQRRAASAAGSPIASRPSAT